MVRCHARVALPAELATALIPSGAGIGQADKTVVEQYTTQTEPRLASMTQGAVQVYELAHHDATHGFFFARGDGAWSFGPWSSDARVLYCRIAGEKLDHLVVIGGTQVEWQGKPLLKAAEPSEFFEWRKRDNVMKAVPGRFSFTPLFEALTGQPMKDDLRAGGKSSTASSDRDSSSYAEKH